MSINLNQIKRRKESSNVDKNSRSASIRTLGLLEQRYRSALSDKDKESFFSEINLLLQSGLDFKQSLEFFIETQKGKKKNVFSEILANILSGLSFSDSLEKANVFSPYDTYSIKIAEETGSLNNVLEELSKFYSSKIQSKRLLVGALSYPVLVLVTSVLALTFLLNFLVPMFTDIYKRLGQDLPAITKLIVSISTFSTNYFIYFVLTGILLGLIIYQQRNKLTVRSAISRILLKSPIIGDIFKHIYLQRFSTSMFFLLEARVPVVNSLGIVNKMIDFYPIEKYIPDMCNKITMGFGLGDALLLNPFFPPRMIAIVRIGEESNKLPEIFSKLSNQYGQEAEYKIKSLGSLIEPVMIIFLAIVVGVILIAMYLPIFKLVNNFGV